MKTLRELNEKTWYRLIKVLLYLPYLLILFYVYGVGGEYHHPLYPETIEIALNDPEFYKVSDDDKIEALEYISGDFFKSLSSIEQGQFIE